MGFKEPRPSMLLAAPDEDIKMDSFLLIHGHTFYRNVNMLVMLLRVVNYIE